MLPFTRQVDEPGLLSRGLVLHVTRRHEIHAHIGPLSRELREPQDTTTVREAIDRREPARLVGVRVEPAAGELRGFVGSHAAGASPDFRHRRHGVLRGGQRSLTVLLMTSASGGISTTAQPLPRRPCRRVWICG